MNEERPRAHAGLGVMLAALGVVYGDIGTSPLYALKECLVPPHGVDATASNLMGILSLIFWSLTLVVTVKYLAFILRADNNGEGGILALLALVPEHRSATLGRFSAVAILGIAGASLLFGDGIITPAISVLSAVEGLEVVTTALKPLVVPLTVFILLALFSLQKRGTGSMGGMFGPVMIVWFGLLAALGLYHITRAPQVLQAVWPGHAVRFFSENGWHAFRLLGSVVLTVTGGEALYADLGHFGARPIRRAWFSLVFPALLLSYFGQGALLLNDPSAAGHVFFAQVPAGLATIPVVIVATAATIIASQALITGAFSLTHQAVQLGYFPRVTIEHKSEQTAGQIYVPEVNWALAFGCLMLVLAFQKSTRLAAAYGIAVSGTMAVTSVLFYVVTRTAWGWPRRKAVPLLLLFLAFDIPFFAANMLKFGDGGWVPIGLGIVFFVVMMTWKWGRDVLSTHFLKRALTWEDFLLALEPAGTMRTPRPGVFLCSRSGYVPPFLLHYVRRGKALPANSILLTVEVERVPAVAAATRYQATPLGEGFTRLVARFGFMERPIVPEILTQASAQGIIPALDPGEVTYFLGRERVVAGPGGRMGRLSEALFAFLNRNARDATHYFGLPHEQVIEIGTRVDL